jgi:hypothetical protein
MANERFTQEDLADLNNNPNYFNRTLDPFWSYLAQQEINLGRFLTNPDAADNADNFEFGHIIALLHMDAEGELDSPLVTVLDDNPAHMGLFSLLQQNVPSPSTHTTAIQSAISKGIVVAVTRDGTIMGTGKYEQLDPGWFWSAFNFAINLLKHSSVVSFKAVPTGQQNNIDLSSISTAGSLRIAIVGDWGTGTWGTDPQNCPAARVANDIVNQQNPVDCIVHLGDVYYAGTGPHRRPKDEEQDNFYAPWAQFINMWGADSSGRSFTLNSNHEMYGGAHGYYEVALQPNGYFDKQNCCSYFTLSFGTWLIICVDSAYYSDKFYMDGRLFTDKAKDQKQLEFLQGISTTGKQTIVMSHHTGFDFKGKKTNVLWDQLTGTPASGNAGIVPDFWYWGHTHNGVVYNQTPVSDIKTQCRIVGHGAIPFGWAKDFKHHQPPNVDYYAHTQVTGSKVLVKNGYAIITLNSDGTIKEEMFEEGNPAPVWCS